MKAGVEKKGEVVALILLLGVAGVVLWRALAPAESEPPSLAEAAVPVSSTSSESLPVRLASLDPRLHIEELAKLRSINYTGTGRDLFHFGSAPALGQNGPGGLPAQHHPSAIHPPINLAPPGPPPPPPIPLRFYGFAQAVGMPEKIFLQMGEDTFVVTQGETIKHRYLIENIGKVSVRVKDLQTQSEQELPLQQG